MSQLNLRSPTAGALAAVDVLGRVRLPRAVNTRATSEAKKRDWKGAREAMAIAVLFVLIAAALALRAFLFLRLL